MPKYIELDVPKTPKGAIRWYLERGDRYYAVAVFPRKFSKLYPASKWEVPEQWDLLPPTVQEAIKKERPYVAPDYIRFDENGRRVAG